MPSSEVYRVDVRIRSAAGVSCPTCEAVVAASEGGTHKQVIFVDDGCFSLAEEQDTRASLTPGGSGAVHGVKPAARPRARLQPQRPLASTR